MCNTINLVLCLNLTRLRKCKLPGLRGGALLRAPGIFSFSNSFRPCFLSTPGPLSLPLPISFTFLCLLPFNFCKPLPNIFLVFLALLLHLFLMQHSLPPFRSPPCFALNVFLSFGRLLRVQPLYEITKRWWTLFPSRVRINILNSEGAN